MHVEKMARIYAAGRSIRFGHNRPPLATLSAAPENSTARIICGLPLGKNIHAVLIYLMHVPPPQIHIMEAGRMGSSTLTPVIVTEQRLPSTILHPLP